MYSNRNLSLSIDQGINLDTVDTKILTKRLTTLVNMWAFVVVIRPTSHRFPSVLPTGVSIAGVRWLNSRVTELFPLSAEWLNRPTLDGLNSHRPTLVFTFPFLHSMEFSLFEIASVYRVTLLQIHNENDLLCLTHVKFRNGPQSPETRLVHVCCEIFQGDAELPKSILSPEGNSQHHCPAREKPFALEVPRMSRKCNDPAPPVTDLVPRLLSK